MPVQVSSRRPKTCRLSQLALTLWPTYGLFVTKAVVSTNHHQQSTTVSKDSLTNSETLLFWWLNSLLRHMLFPLICHPSRLKDKTEGKDIREQKRERPTDREAERERGALPSWDLTHFSNEREWVQRNTQMLHSTTETHSNLHLFCRVHTSTHADTPKSVLSRGF